METHSSADHGYDHVIQKFMDSNTMPGSAKAGDLGSNMFVFADGNFPFDSYLVHPNGCFLK